MLNPESSIETIKDYIHHIDVITVMTVDPGFAGQPFIEESLTKIHLLNEYKIKKIIYYMKSKLMVHVTKILTEVWQKRERIAL